VFDLTLAIDLLVALVLVLRLVRFEPRHDSVVFHLPDDVRRALRVAELEEHARHAQA
jgi:hypothetical protein